MRELRIRLLGRLLRARHRDAGARTEVWIHQVPDEPEVPDAPEVSETAEPEEPEDAVHGEPVAPGDDQRRHRSDHPTRGDPSETG